MFDREFKEELIGPWIIIETTFYSVLNESYTLSFQSPELLKP